VRHLQIGFGGIRASCLPDGGAEPAQPTLALNATNRRRRAALDLVAGLSLRRTRAGRAPARGGQTATEGLLPLTAALTNASGRPPAPVRGW
jgi:hypothetical protein